MLCMVCLILIVFFFKQNTAYELRISDWSSDVCSSDLFGAVPQRDEPDAQKRRWCHECSECHDVQPGGDTVAAREAVSDRYGDNGDDGCGERGRQKTVAHAVAAPEQVGRASVRERVCRYELISVVDGHFKKKQYIQE